MKKLAFVFVTVLTIGFASCISCVDNPVTIADGTDTTDIDTTTASIAEAPAEAEAVVETPAN